MALLVVIGRSYHNAYPMRVGMTQFPVGRTRAGTPSHLGSHGQESSI